MPSVRLSPRCVDRPGTYLPPTGGGDWPRSDRKMGKIRNHRLKRAFWLAVRAHLHNPPAKAYAFSQTELGKSGPCGAV
jgi:hypothetical protein